MPYTDTPQPRVFANVSPLDPQLFSTITEHVDDLLAGRANAKYSPAEVAAWLEQLLSRASAPDLASTWARRMPRPRRLVEDVAIQLGIAHFFAAKLQRRALFRAMAEGQKPRRRVPRRRKLSASARDAWAEMAERARRVYAADVSYGEIPQRRGHWCDRLAAIDARYCGHESRGCRSAWRDAGAAFCAAIAQPPQRA